MRIIADHSRGAVNLIADGVVPSNEERGYVLRRIMRRAIQQGRVLGLEAPYLGRFAERVIELMGGAYPHLEAERDSDHALGRRRGGELRPHARPRHRAARRSWSPTRRARAPRGSTPRTPFSLHDTYGFPYDLTKELLAEQGLAVDDDGFEALMEAAARRARAAAARAPRRTATRR